MKLKINLVYIAVLVIMIALPVYAQGRSEYGNNVYAKDYLQRKEFVDKIRSLEPVVKGNKYESSMSIKNYQYNFIDGKNQTFEKDMLNFLNIYKTENYKLIPTGTMYFSYSVQEEGWIHVRVFHDIFYENELRDYELYIASIEKNIPKNINVFTDSEKLKEAYSIVSSQLNVGSTLGDWRYYNNHIRLIQHDNFETLCDGWSRFSSEVLNLVGLKSKVVYGFHGTGLNRVEHAWNMVKVDGKWVFVDFMYAKTKKDYLFMNMTIDDLRNKGYMIDIGNEKINTYS